ncbi:DMT family transporter [Pseudoflavitalea sp. G-6-1-2]|uniref:DMT family transporter n=1 Tax=Pseudoflavitalea sp. G-6-1-2 TaxID=2728841 RepID=UPI001469B979|nr:DMT family transporter [Pseudoflavitalea sp. G-6-1-2]NML22376.1 DMT family transporter [Pseudoflavitalea sp. G-6-1-2]
MGVRVKGYLLAILSSVSYGLIPLFVLPIKAAGFPMDTTLFYRFIIAALFMLAWLIYRKVSLKVSGGELLILIALGVLFSLSSHFLFIGYDYSTPGIASTILFVYPVIVALLMWIFFKETISRLTVLSLFIAIAGVFVLSAKESVTNINFPGIFFSLCSAFFYAIYIVLVNKGRLKIPGILITFYSMLFSAAYYLCKISITGDVKVVPDGEMIINIAVFAFATSVISITALVAAIKLIGSTPTSIMGAMEPVIAVAISVLLFNEKFTLSLFAGIAMILFGVITNIVADSKKEAAQLNESPQQANENIVH